MPKQTIDYPSHLNFRVSEQLKTELLAINKSYAVPAREAIEQYLPIKKLLLNPLSLPRVIINSQNKIEFSISEDGVFQITIDDKIISVDSNDLKILQANIYLFTLNTVEV